MAEKAGAKTVKFGYGLSLKSARQWGLYISTSRGKTSLGIDEPPLFGELRKNDAALFLVLGAAVAEVQALEFHLVQMMGLLLAPEGESHTEVTEHFF